MLGDILCCRIPLQSDITSGVASLYAEASRVVMRFADEVGKVRLKRLMRLTGHRRDVNSLYSQLLSLRWHENVSDVSEVPTTQEGSIEVILLLATKLRLSPDARSAIPLSIGPHYFRANIGGLTDLLEFLLQRLAG
jgi:hypothetical protein